MLAIYLAHIPRRVTLPPPCLLPSLSELVPALVRLGLGPLHSFACPENMREECACTSIFLCGIGFFGSFRLSVRLYDSNIRYILLNIRAQ